MQSTNNWSCGITKIIDTFSGKWQLNILWTIHKNEGIGFNKLRKNIDGISNISLVRSLNILLKDKYISKKIIGDVPPFQSEYHLTNKAKSLLPLLLSLNDWGKHSI